MKLEGQQRTLFLENEGRRYAKAPYYKSVEEAFAALLDFKPLMFLEFDKICDYAPFYRGYKEVAEYRALIDTTAAKAQAENSLILTSLTKELS